MEYLQNIDLSKIRSLCLQKKREFIFNYCLFEQLKNKQLKQKKYTNNQWRRRWWYFKIRKIY